VLQQLDGEGMLKSNRSYGPLTMGQQDESPVIITISANTTEHYTEHLP